MTTRELEQLLGHPLKPKWTVVLTADGRHFVREAADDWYETSSEPLPPPSKRKAAA